MRKKLCRPKSPRSHEGGDLKVCALDYANSDKDRTRGQATKFSRLLDVLSGRKPLTAIAAWDSMHLRRIDPDRNMARFYSMSVQPNLFGEWALLREWGRIGSAGRLVSGRFASEQEAALAMAEYVKAKLSKGYEPV